jgi:hypothetical protein
MFVQPAMALAAKGAQDDTVKITICRFTPLLAVHLKPSLEPEIGRPAPPAMLGMIKEGVTYLAVAADRIIESFRNDVWPGYKTGKGIEQA